MLEFFNNTNGFKMENNPLWSKLGVNIKISHCVRDHQVELEINIFPEWHPFLFTQNCCKMLVVWEGPGHTLHKNSITNIYLYQRNMPTHQCNFIFQLFVIFWQDSRNYFIHGLIFLSVF